MQTYAIKVSSTAISNIDQIYDQIRCYNDDHKWY